MRKSNAITCAASIVGIWLWLCLSVVCIATKAAHATDELSHRIREVAEAELRQSGAPSLQIAVARDGHVIFQDAYGLADLEQNVPATVQSKYRTASVSKWLRRS